MIIESRTRHIIPFIFGSPEQSKRDFIRLLDLKTDVYKGTWKESTVKSGEQDLYEYVLNSFDDSGVNSPGNIGAVYKYVPAAGEDRPVLSLSYSDDKYHFDIDKAGMVLFVSGIGFFWYEFSKPIRADGSPMDEKEYVVFNNRFKELDYEKNLRRFSVMGLDNVFSTGNWISVVVEAACGNVRFFSERKNTLTYPGCPKYVPDKALIYNYVLFNEKSSSKDILWNIYHLTKGYDQNYKQPEDIEKRIFRPFENVIWYACSEGTGYYACPDESSIRFFKDGMKQRFLNDYFLIYIMTLNVEYSIIRFSGEISTLLPADPVNYFSSDLYLDASGLEEGNSMRMLDLERAIRRLVTEINVFIVKNVRPSVSYIDHHNEFYRYVYDSLRIGEETQVLTSGLSSLQQLLQNSAGIEQEINREEVFSWRKEQDYRKLKSEKEILQRELYTDSMTGLYNRKAMTYYSRSLYSEAKQTGKALFICVADMNGLKYINDNFGHEHGDRAIKELAEIIKESLVEGDYAFRTGGDEFLIMGLREKTEGLSQYYSKKVEALIEKHNEDLDLPYKVDMSYGPLVSLIDGSEGGLDKLLRDSDEMMYEMKKSRDPHRRE